MKNRAMSITDHLKNIHNTTKKWEDMTEEEQKSFSIFIVNKYLSMNPNYLEMVNALQQYTVGTLKAKEVFKLYSGLLFGRLEYHPYIKKRTKDKYKDELLTYLSMYFETSKANIIEYLDISFKTNDGIEYIIDILQKYGLNEKKIKNAGLSIF